MRATTRALFAALAVHALCAAPTLVAADGPSIASSVVSLDVVIDEPDLMAPWQTKGIEYSGGSGVIIEGRRILTNAHVVESAVSIEVKRADGSERFPGTVEFISHDADLALVRVEDARFFEGARPVPLGQMPKLQQRVVVFGFPIGGTTLSITSGIVSRVEVDMYLQSKRNLLTVQIDAAINEGNSGGPVVSEGEIVGIAMQGMEHADNVGYMIPTPVIRHFIDDVADGRYDGFPRMGIHVQDMESADQRRAARMDPSQSGALVTRVDYASPAYGVIRPRDVLLAIEDRPLASDLTISWPGLGRVDYSLAVQSRQIGETIDVTLQRAGQKLEKKITLRPHTPLVPGRRTTEWPRYYQFGGIVFQPLSEEFIDDPDAVYPDSIDFALVNNLVTKERREIILLGQILPHPVNRGYQDWGGETVRLINGVIPRDLRHVASIIDNAKGKWLRVVTGDGWVLTLDREAARRANSEILRFYGIMDDRYLGEGSGSSKHRRRRRP